MRGWLTVLDWMLGAEREKRHREEMIEQLKSEADAVVSVDLLPMVLRELRLRSAEIERDE